MSFATWLRNGWLTAHKPSREEIRDIFALVDRDLQAATAALAAAGYRAAREAHHVRVIHSLSFSIGADGSFVRQFDAFRKKRNLSSYETGGGISNQEAEEMAALAEELSRRVREWIRKHHPRLA